MGRSRRKPLPKEPVEARIESLTHDGKGVAHIDGKATFIYGSLPGELVRFLYTSQRRKYDEGRVVEVLLSAVSPMQLMTGKILGQMAVGLIILGIYSGMGVVALVSFALLATLFAHFFVDLVLHVLPALVG